MATRDLDQDGLHELIITRGAYDSVSSVALYRYVGGAFVQEGPDYEVSEGTDCYIPWKPPQEESNAQAMGVILSADCLG